MANDEIFESAVRSIGDLAGVYEHDGETGYFYLYDTRNEGAQKVIGAIPVLSGTSDFQQKDVAVRWDCTESKVGLYIYGKLWAVFDGATGAKYGGHYRPHTSPEIPANITSAFEEVHGLRPTPLSEGC